MSRKQTLLNTNVPSAVAETASIFGELLLTDLLLSSAKTDEEHKALLCLVLDEAGMTAFQVTARVWFEQSLYGSIEKGEYMVTKPCQPLDKVAGQNLRRRSHMGPRNGSRMDHEAPLLHGKLPLLQLSICVCARLYTHLRAILGGGESVCAKFVELLSSGSSRSPMELGTTVGLDVADIRISGVAGLKCLSVSFQSLKRHFRPKNYYQFPSPFFWQ